MMFLNADQLRDLTGKRQCAAQARVLRGLGIKHGIRPDGSLVVMEAAVDAVLGPGATSRLRKSAPDFGAVA